MIIYGINARKRLSFMYNSKYKLLNKHLILRCLNSNGDACTSINSTYEIYYI